MLLQLSHFFSPLYPPLPGTPIPSSNPPTLSSCPWVIYIYISSLASLRLSIFYLPIMLFIPCTGGGGGCRWKYNASPSIGSLPANASQEMLFEMNVFTELGEAPGTESSR